MSGGDSGRHDPPDERVPAGDVDAAASELAPAVEARILASPRLTRLIWDLSWPVIAGMGLHSLFSLTDLFWVGRVGTAAVAAISTAIFMTWILMAASQLVTVGMVAVVARRIGGARREEAAAAALQGFFWAAVTGIVAAGAGQVLSEPVFRAISDDPEVVRQGTVYIRLLTGAAPVLFVFLTFQEIFRATGDTRTPFRILALALVLNFLLDPFLIHGYGPFPEWGTGGAAVATILSRIVGIAVYVAATGAGRHPLNLRAPARGFRPSGILGRQFLAIGLPMASISVGFSAVYLVLGRIAAGFGTETLAALGVGNRLESLSFLVVHGIGVATATLVGQNLGAGQPERAERLAARASQLGMAVGAGAMVLFLAVPEPLMRIFTADPGTISEGVRFLRILALCQVLQAWELVLEGGFAGAGHTTPAMLVSLPVSVLRIPLAWWLSGPGGLGADGIWWTITATAILRGVALRIWWGRGSWKRELPGDAPRGSGV